MFLIRSTYLYIYMLKRIKNNGVVRRSKVRCKYYPFSIFCIQLHLHLQLGQATLWSVQRKKKLSVWMEASASWWRTFQTPQDTCASKKRNSLCGLCSELLYSDDCMFHTVPLLIFTVVLHDVAYNTLLFYSVLESSYHLSPPLLHLELLFYFLFFFSGIFILPSYL